MVLPIEFLVLFYFELRLHRCELGLNFANSMLLLTLGVVVVKAGCQVRTCLGRILL